MRPAHDACAICRYFEGSPGFDGHCHRLPPAVIKTKTDEYAMWPRVQPDEWCGEFKERRVETDREQRQDGGALAAHDDYAARISRGGEQ